VAALVRDVGAAEGEGHQFKVGSPAGSLSAARFCSTQGQQPGYASCVASACRRPTSVIRTRVRSTGLLAANVRSGCAVRAAARVR